MRVKKFLTMTLVLLIGLRGVVFANEPTEKLILDRDSAVKRLLNEGELEKTLDTSIETLKKNVQPIVNAASGQKGFQEDYNEIVAFMGDALPADFYMDNEAQFDAFYSIRVMEPLQSAQLQNLQLDRSNIEKTAYQQIDAYLNPMQKLKKQWAVNTALESLKKRDVSDLKLKFKSGDVSANTLKIAEKDLAILESQNAILKRQIESLELELKRILAIDMATEVEWKESYRVMIPKTLEPVEFYETKALESDVRLLKQKNLESAAKKSYDLYKEIYYKLTERERAKLDFEKAQNETHQLKMAILIEVRDAYADVQLKEKTFRMEKEKLQVEQLKYKNAQAQYEAKRLTKLDLDRVEWQTESQHNTVMEAYAAYALATNSFTETREDKR